MTTTAPAQTNNEFIKEVMSSLIAVPGALRFVQPGSNTSQTQRENGKPTDADMELINKLSKNGNLDPASLYVFEAIPSTQAVDSFYTRMDVTSLYNYAANAREGVPVLNSHRSGGFSPAELPIGRSFNGAVEDNPDMPGTQMFTALAYMLRNNKANGSVNTDDIIASMEAGITSDVSIGFGFQAGTKERGFEDRTWLRCAICGQDWLKADPWSDNPDVCRHWPGEVYAYDSGTRKDLCVLDVVNGTLNEFSAVYAGSTPGAVIRKAERAAQSGRLDRATIHRLENTYRVRLIGTKAFQAPALENRAGKTDTKVPDVDTKVKDTKAMADNQNQDNVRLEGQKEAIALQVRTIMGVRALSDDELALCQLAMDYASKGDMENATGCIARLMGGDNAMEPDGDENGMDYDQDGDGQVPVENPANSAAPVEPGSDASQNPTNTDEGRDEDANGAVLRSEPGKSNLISLSLTANERQQFKALEREVITLRKEVKTLRQSAAIGERYRDMLVAETAKQAVRADMPEADTLDMLNHLPVEHIERLCVHYRNIGDARLGKVNEEGLPLLIGGRQTVATDPNRPDFERNASVKIDNLPVKSVDLKAFR